MKYLELDDVYVMAPKVARRGYEPLASRKSFVSFRHMDGIWEVSKLKKNDSVKHAEEGTTMYRCFSDKSAEELNEEAFNPEFYGEVPSIKTHAEFLEKGWDEGARRLRDFGREVETRIGDAIAVKRSPVRRDYGDEVDMNRVYSGRMETAWRRTERVTKRHNTDIVLMVCLSKNSHYNGDSFFWPGASCLAVSDKLEEAGFNVKIVAYSMTYSPYRKRGGSKANHQDYNFHLMDVKSPSERLNIDRLAVITCHPSTFRTAFFAMKFCGTRPVRSGLGISCYDMETMDDLMRITGMAREYGEEYYVFSDIHDEEAAVFEAKRILTEINGITTGKVSI